MPAVHRRFVLRPSGTASLPLFVESIGDNPDQEPFSRPQGYPLYHWLQTVQGEGIMTFSDKTVRLPANSGVLAMPGVPHSYAAAESPWRTAYLTFGGPAAREILQALDIQESEHFQWEAGNPLAALLGDMMARIDTEADLLGLQASVDAYRFLITLRTYGSRPQKNGTLHRRVETLRPLIEWMDSAYADPSIGLEEIAARIGMPVSSLGVLFRRTLGVSPYAYLLQLRIRKAQDLLISRPDTTVGAVAAMVGFRDISHFVATFRKQVGMPPMQFRRLWAAR